MPPKRKPRHLDAIRIELNERERDLVEGAILGNVVSGVAGGIGNAIGGLGLALGAVAAVIVWKEGTDWFRNQLAQSEVDWVNENCTQEKYDAYFAGRQDQWIRAARLAGRYGPDKGTINDLGAYALYVGFEPMTFQEWEEKNGAGMMFDEWCQDMKAQTTFKRRALVGSLFPPLSMVGIWQYGLTDWLTGRK